MADNSNQLFNVIFRTEIAVEPRPFAREAQGQATQAKPTHTLPGPDPHYGVDRFAYTIISIAIKMLEIVPWMQSMRVRFAFLSGLSFAIWTYAGRPNEVLYKTIQWKLLTAAQLPTVRGATAELRELNSYIKSWLKKPEGGVK